MSFPGSGAEGLRMARPGGPGNTLVPRWQERHEDHQAQLLAQLRSRGAKRAPPRRPTTGRYTGLCLLIDFPDRPATVSREEVQAFCNQAGYRGFGNQGSVADYFADVSNGRLRYEQVVLPYHRASQPFSFYDASEVPWPERAGLLIEEALQAHRAAGVDFGALSVDDAQAVYAINVFHAGAIAAVRGAGMWPHAWRLARPTPLADGCVAVDYQLSAMGDALSLGVYCHENGHMLCDFPDLYDNATSRRGIGRYCLMCLGCNADPHNPTRPTAYLRWRAGWGEATPLTAGPQRLPPAARNAFLLHRRSDTEYLLLENRLGQGRDAALASSGLAIWHVDELGSNYDLTRAASGHAHAECRLLQADGLDELDLGLDDGDGSDLFGRGREPRLGFVGLRAAERVDRLVEQQLRRVALGRVHEREDRRDRVERRGLDGRLLKAHRRLLLREVAVRVEGDRRLLAEHRHQLPVAPHVRFAPHERLACPRPRGLQVVAREQRRAAATEVMASTGIEGRSPTGNGALEVREVGGRHALTFARPRQRCQAGWHDDFSKAPTRSSRKGNRGHGSETCQSRVHRGTSVRSVSVPFLQCFEL